MDWFNTWILPNWPFFAVSAVLGFIGTVMKKIITAAHASKSKLAWWFRATLPLHPVAAGIVIGAFDVLPTSLGATGRAGGALYFGVAGAASAWVYTAAQHFLEKRVTARAAALQAPSESAKDPK